MQVIEEGTKQSLSSGKHGGKSLDFLICSGKSETQHYSKEQSWPKIENTWTNEKYQILKKNIKTYVDNNLSNC